MNFSKEKTAAVKGFAILVMLFHHCFRAASIYTGYEINFYPFSEQLVNNVATFFKLCVGTFAFLSGYGLSIKWKESCFSENKRKGYFVKRYVSTLSGYWFVFIACCVVAECLDGRTKATYFSKSIFENVFGIISSFLGISRITGTPMLIYEWWYMGAAVVFILLVPLFSESIDKIGALATMAVVVLFPRVFGVEFMGGTQPLSFFMPVLLGVIFERKQLFDQIHFCLTAHFRRYVGRVFITLLGVTVGLLAYKMYRRLPFESYWEVKYGIVPVMIIVCLNETVLYAKWIRNVLSFFGKHSMNMYLVHMMFITYMKEILFADQYFLFSWIALVLLSLATSIVLEWVKKVIGWSNIINSLEQRI